MKREQGAICEPRIVPPGIADGAYPEPLTWLTVPRFDEPRPLPSLEWHDAHDR